MNSSPKIFAVIPAAGSGSRMQSSVPKQYLQIDGLPIIFYALRTLISCPQICRVLLVLSPRDEIFSTLNLENFLDFSKVTVLKIGGKTRAESVFNALQYAKQNFQNFQDFHDFQDFQKTFALIHDAARPLLKLQTLQKFIQQILLSYQQNPSQNVGGLLAMPLADTLKSEKNQQVIKTIPREHLFLAQTPQMFLFDVLFSALQNCADCCDFTDESSAVEKLNFHPLLVEGERSNFKITYPNDLQLAEILLKSNFYF